MNKIMIILCALQMCNNIYASQEKQITRVDLHTAIIQDNIDRIRSFLVNGGDVNIRGEGGVTMLKEAAGLHSDSIIKMLVEEYKADVNAEDNYKQTPLMSAAWMGGDIAVQYLLNHGAHIDAQDINGDTTLKRLISLGHHDIAKILIANKADVNLADNKGATPLMLAAFYCDSKYIDLLLKSGAKISTDKKNNTTITYAVMQPLSNISEKMRRDVVHRLLDYSNQDIKKEIRIRMYQVWYLYNGKKFDENGNPLDGLLPLEIIQNISRLIIKPIIEERRALLATKNNNGKSKTARDYAEDNKWGTIVTLIDDICDKETSVKAVGRLLFGDNPPERIKDILPYEFGYRTKNE